MIDVPQTVVVAAGIVLVGLLLLRIVVAIPRWIRSTRRPERRAIQVIGVGGAGSNSVDRMAAARIPGVGFIACNTDAQALRNSAATTKIRIGDAITHGLGSGGDPDIGRQAAEADEGAIVRALAGADLVFVTAGLGGGTGSGAAPIVGAVARAQSALTVGVVTKPFAFEGAKRRRVAELAAEELASNVDALITIPNDRISDAVADDTSVLDAFRVVDDVVLQAVRGVIDLLRGPGLINLDFADVRAVLRDAGPAVIGLGYGSGDNRAIDAARQAIASPLVEASIQGAHAILFNVSGPPDLRLHEVREAADAIRASADPDANVIFGASLSRSPGEDVLISLIATGLDKPRHAATTAKTASPAHGASPVKAEGRSSVEPTGAEVVTALPAETETDGHREQKRPPKRAVAVEPRETAVVESGAAPPAEARAATRPQPPARSKSPNSTPIDEVDLEIPSFLRRRQPPESRR